MNVEPKIDERLYFRTEIATGEIEGRKYSVTQNVDSQAFFVEFEEEGKPTIHVCFPTPLRVMVKEAFKFVYEREGRRK